MSIASPSILAGPRMTPAHRLVREADAFGNNRPVLVATVEADRWQLRWAAAVVILLAGCFVIAVPIARRPLAPVPAFIPAYEAALLVIDLVTAVIVVGQFLQLRTAALLALAGGYLLDALLVVPHALSFPGLLTPRGWLGAGGETTAWLYMFWHGGFAVFVIAYAVAARQARRSAPGVLGSGAVFTVVGTVVGLAGALTILAVHADTLLPPIMAGNGYTAAMRLVIGSTWVLSLGAVLALSFNRPYTVLDCWLMAVMCAWLLDIGLSAVLNGGRFDVGFYAGRVYGLLAASIVLSAILIQSMKLQAQASAVAVRLGSDARDLNRRVAEGARALAETNRKLSAMMDASPYAIFMVDRQGAVNVWSASAERVFGYTAEEAIGRHPPYLLDEQMASYRSNLARALTAERTDGILETQRQRKDGKVMDLRVHWTRVLDDAGEMLGILYAAEDITEARKLENQLRHSQKMEAIGNLTGGMAHDFNNLLGIIIGNLDLLREVKQDAESEELATEALDAALRGADLTRRLLAFARRQPLKPEKTDLNELVAGIAKLLKRTLREDIEVTLQLAADVWPVMVDPAQLESSITNLAN